MPIKIDPSKLKFLESLPGKVVLKHNDGHLITVALDVLSPKARKQMEAWAETAQDFAKTEHGKVTVKEPKAQGHGRVGVKPDMPQDLGKVTVIDNTPAKPDFGKVKMAGVAPAAAGPQVTTPGEFVSQGYQSYQDNVVTPIASTLKETFTPDIQTIQGQTHPTSSPVSDALIEGASDLTNYLPGPAGALATAASMAPKKPMANGGIVDEITPDVATMEVDVDKENQKIANNEVSRQLHARGWDAARDASDPRFAGAKAQAEASVNGPVPTGIAVPEEAVTVETIAPDQGLTPSNSATLAPDQGLQDPINQQTQSMQGGINQQIQGIQGQANAQSQLAQEKEQVYQEQIKADQEAMAAYQSTESEVLGEREALIQDIRDGHVSPEKFWKGDPKTGEGGHSKLMTAIGIILAGFNPTNSPNAAIEFLNKQMDANLRAQAQNLSSKENLLAANSRRLGDLRAGYELTRLQSRDIMIAQLETAAAKAQNPLAQAAAQQAIGQLQAQQGQEMAKYAQQATVRKLEADAMQDPSKMPAYISALKATDPKRADEVEQKLVPGLGIASSNEGAKGLREMQATVKTVKDATSRLREILKTPGKALSPGLRKEASNLRNLLVGRLRVPITGPGAMNEGEQERMLQIIPGVANIFSLDSNSKVALDTLERDLTNNYRNQAIANGLNIPEAAPRSTDRKAQAMEWLKQNPKHPKAAGIKKALGVK